MLLGIPVAAVGSSQLSRARVPSHPTPARGRSRPHPDRSCSRSVSRSGTSRSRSTWPCDLHVCDRCRSALLCAGTYLLVATTAVLAWRLARVDLGVRGERGRRPRSARSWPARRIAVGVAAIAALQFATRPISGTSMTADQVKSRDPEFYDWYTKRPIAKDLPPARHSKGPADAPLTIIEFSDFECPPAAWRFAIFTTSPSAIRISSASCFTTSRSIRTAIRTCRRVMHRSACLAAIASECAARDGKFWPYHDLLFTGQDHLGREDLIAKAVGLGMSADAFTACLDDPDARAHVLSDAGAGAKLGIKSTPTLVINGRTVEGALERSRYEYVIALERRS